MADADFEIWPPTSEANKKRQRRAEQHRAREDEITRKEVVEAFDRSTGVITGMTERLGKLVARLRARHGPKKAAPFEKALAELDAAKHEMTEAITRRE